VFSEVSMGSSFIILICAECRGNFLENDSFNCDFCWHLFSRRHCISPVIVAALKTSFVRLPLASLWVCSPLREKWWFSVRECFSSSHQSSLPWFLHSSMRENDLEP